VRCERSRRRRDWFDENVFSSRHALLLKRDLLLLIRGALLLMRGHALLTDSGSDSAHLRLHLVRAGAYRSRGKPSSTPRHCDLGDETFDRTAARRDA
jgi:hypothetical protein